MSGRAYSTRFLRGAFNSAAAANLLKYTVPVGKVIVVRSVDLFVDQVGVGIFGMLSPSWAAFASTANVPIQNVRTWEGRQVFTAGEVLGATWISGNHSLLVSGYLLDA